MMSMDEGLYSYNYPHKCVHGTPIFWAQVPTPWQVCQQCKDEHDEVEWRLIHMKGTR